MAGYRSAETTGISGPRIGVGSSLLGDGTQIGLRDKSVDYGQCIAVTHHLTDAQLPKLVAELARVVRKKLFFLDALDTDAWQSTLMWKYDRGSNPRTARRSPLRLSGNLQLSGANPIISTTATCFYPPAHTSG